MRSSHESNPVVGRLLLATNLPPSTQHLPKTYLWRRSVCVFFGFLRLYLGLDHRGFVPVDGAQGFSDLHLDPKQNQPQQR